MRKMLYGQTFLAGLLVAAAACMFAAQASAGAGGSDTSGREKVGLVLAGGGARGIAHAGVIRALEEMRIPIDAIAGTSMGALVGGLYATGMDAQDLQRVIAGMQWDEAFEDALERNARPQRRKGDDYDYPTEFRLSFSDGVLSIPLGLVQGQQTRQLIKSLVYQASTINDFDTLPIPLRTVATDIETGEAYIFSSGDIVTAMRASMSLPALLAPVEYDGRLLVDGGMAMNIPVEVGQQMGVDRVIVVDIGTPLKTREEITSLLSVTSQTMGFLTRRNSLVQLEKMRPQDILVSPELGPVGMLDFDQVDLIYQRGYKAAEALEEQLAGLGVDEETWSAYLAQRALPAAIDSPIEFIAIKNDGPVSDELIRVRISQPIGQALDREQLVDDIATIYALNYWEIIDYDIIADERGSGLQINARTASWGTDKLKLGLTTASDLDGNSEINIGGSFLRKGITDLGGEFYSRIQVGDTTLFSAEFYQPLDVRSRFFVLPFAGYEHYEVLTLGPEYSATDTRGAWNVRRGTAELAGGINMFSSSQLRAGLFRGIGEYREDRSSADKLPEDSFDEGGVFASFRYDSLDNPFFPTDGGFFYVDYGAFREDFGGDDDFERWRIAGQAAFSFGKEDANIVVLTAKTGQSNDAPNEPQNYFQLGGLFNLSGTSQNFYSGRQSVFAMAQYHRRLSDQTVVPVDLPFYVGASIEGGQLWSDRSDIDAGELITAGSIYVAVDTPIGPIFVAYGRTEESLDAIYLSIGWPFMLGNLRMGR